MQARSWRGVETILPRHIWHGVWNVYLYRISVIGNYLLVKLIWTGCSLQIFTKIGVSYIFLWNSFHPMASDISVVSRTGNSRAVSLLWTQVTRHALLWWPVLRGRSEASGGPGSHYRSALVFLAKWRCVILLAWDAPYCGYYFNFLMFSSIIIIAATTNIISVLTSINVKIKIYHYNYHYRFYFAIYNHFYQHYFQLLKTLAYIYASTCACACMFMQFRKNRQKTDGVFVNAILTFCSPCNVLRQE